MLSTKWWVRAALAVILSVRVLADRSGQSPAVLLVLAGLAVSLLPVPSAELEPHLILEVVILPLLFVVHGLSSFDRGTVVAAVAVTAAGVLGFRLSWLLTRPRVDGRALSLRDVTAPWWADTSGSSHPRPRARTTSPSATCSRTARSSCC